MQGAGCRAQGTERLEPRSEYLGRWSQTRWSSRRPWRDCTLCPAARPYYTLCPAARPYCTLHPRARWARRPPCWTALAPCPVPPALYRVPPALAQSHPCKSARAGSREHTWVWVRVRVLLPASRFPLHFTSLHFTSHLVVDVWRISQLSTSPHTSHLRLHISHLVVKA